jgi:hypothetical protein
MCLVNLVDCVSAAAFVQPMRPETAICCFRPYFFSECDVTVRHLTLFRELYKQSKSLRNYPPFASLGFCKNLREICKRDQPMSVNQNP